MPYLVQILSLVITFLIASASVEADHLANAPHEKNATQQTKNAHNSKKAKHRKHNQKIAKAYKQYKKKVGRVWGKEAVLPSARRDVTYRNNLKERSVVDYEEGLVKVELALMPSKISNEQEVYNKLELAIERTILQGADIRSIEEIAKNPEPPDTGSSAVLAGLIANSDGSPFSIDELADFKLAKAHAMETHQLKGKDGKARIIVSAQFNMVPDHIRVRAERFRESVDRYAQDLEIPVALIYAIIETESSFNPRAKSPAPAFGLMQLMPTRAARDAFKFLYSKDRVVKERYLYVPDKNIELGTAYLHLLYHRYFKSIKNPESRKWATIAAYNAGPRNVIKALSGRYTKKRYTNSYSWKKHAFNKINKMSSKQAYAYLRKKMPAGETRRYLKKVHKRMGKYSVSIVPDPIAL